MPTLQIGRKEIPYELRRSATASERRITITPGHVEVLALTSDNDDDIAGFLERKRQWLFNTVREMEKITASRHVVPRFMTGSKIPYRGRKMPLAVRPLMLSKSSLPTATALPSICCTGQGMIPTVLLPANLSSG